MIKKSLTIGVISTTLSLLTGCTRHPNTPQDPYENFNRVMFSLNMGIDYALLRPTTHVYNTMTPPFAQKGVTNFFHNIGELTTIPNDMLQGKLAFTVGDFMRFFINTTLGVGGLFDVASHIGLKRHVNNFGLTLAYWEGGKPSPYLILPLIGPGTFRSHFGQVMDIPTTPYFYVNSKYDWALAGAKGLDIVSNRNKYMDANKLIDTAYDPYIFMRDVYLNAQNARVKINQHENFNSKQRVSEDRLTTADFDQGAADGDNTAAASKAISANTLKEHGYVFDNTPAKTSSKKAQKPQKSPQSKK